MLAFAVTSLDSATKTLVNDSVRLHEGKESANKRSSRIDIETYTNRITYSTMFIIGVINMILLVTGFPRLFTIVFCLLFVPFFVRAIVYVFKFALGKMDFSSTGTISPEEYDQIRDQD